uniref:Peptide transporter family 1 n=1 Tax=Parascaris univalens TaxID=6257 RepID=A0A914ZV38_PARUN
SVAAMTMSISLHHLSLISNVQAHKLFISAQHFIFTFMVHRPYVLAQNWRIIPMLYYFFCL